MEKLAGEQLERSLLSSNIFHRCTLNFPKIQTDAVINLLFNFRDQKIGHFGIFLYVLSISDIF